tara:strand:- start:7748 stop:10066 length:2319 start_codon:yes stop_codon:yes gene_type:complete
MDKSLPKKENKYVGMPSWVKKKDDILENQSKYILNNHKGIAYYTGKINNLIVVDFDSPEPYDNFIEKYPEFEDNLTIKTYRGFHIYFPYKGNERFNKSDSNEEKKIDVRSDGGIIVGCGTYRKCKDFYYEVFNEGQIQGIIPDEIYNLYNWTKPKRTVNSDTVKSDTVKSDTVKSDTNIIIPITKYHYNILDNIDLVKYATSYNDWCKFIWAIKMTFENSLEIADKYCKKIENYNGIEDVENFMNTATQNRIGFGYLMKLSQLSNKNNHYSIIRSNNSFNECDDLALAKVAIQLLRDDIIKIKNGESETFYFYENPYWKEATENIIQKSVRRSLSSYYEILIQNIKVSNPEDESENEQAQKKREILMTHKKKCHSFSCSKNIAKTFMQEFDDNSNIKMDTYKPYYFCFANCAFNLKTNKLVEVQKEHYITVHTGYDYIEPEEKHISFYDDLIKQVFPNEEIRKCYISIMRMKMIGINPEKIVISNGGGGNGKGLYNEHMATMLGNYHLEGDIQTLTEERKGAGNASSDIMAFKNKRSVVFGEPEDYKKLQIGIIKKLTGGDSITGRELYKSTETIRLMSLIDLETNTRIKLNCKKIDDSLIRRFILIMFESTFTDNEDLLKLPNYHRKNPLYKTSEFKEEYKFGLFKWLLNQNQIDIEMNDYVRKISREYLDESDLFLEWSKSKYEITGDIKDCIKVSDFYKTYKENNFKEGTRKFKTFNKKEFINIMNESNTWKSHYQLFYNERHKNLRNIILGVKIIVDDEEEEPEFIEE